MCFRTVNPRGGGGGGGGGGGVGGGGGGGGRGTLSIQWSIQRGSAQKDPPFLDLRYLKRKGFH